MSRVQVWVGVGLAAASVAFLVVGVLRQAGRVTIDPPPASPGLEDSRRESEDLDARLEATLTRLLEKHAITVALAHGEIGFPEAVNRFRPLVAARPAALDNLRRVHPGATETELLYRHVLEFVRARLRAQSDVAPALLARLEAEVARVFPAGADCPPATAGVPRVRTPTARAE